MLYIIPTPIGNLKDITLRAIETLKATDFIIVENPAHTAKLLQHFEIRPLPTLSSSLDHELGTEWPGEGKYIVQFAQHTEIKILPQLIKRLQKENGALVTDAGTPGISDPGFRLVRACVEANIKIESLPGANAATTALVASGLPTDKYLFLGFLGKTEPKVLKAIEEAKNISATAIFYESPERLKKTVDYIAKHYPVSKMTIARELTKVHEEYIRGTALEVAEILKNRQNIKGEITVIISFK